MKTPSLESVEVWGIIAVGAILAYVGYELYEDIKKLGKSDSVNNARSFLNELFDTAPPAVSNPDVVTANSPDWKKQGLGGADYPGTVPGTYQSNVDQYTGQTIPDRGGALQHAVPLDTGANT